MHFFDSVRRYSRNGGTTSSKRSPQTTQAPAVPPSPSISTTPRQPLVPQTNLTNKLSQSSLASQTPSSESSGQNSSSKLGRNSGEDSDVSKATQSKVTRAERSNTVGGAYDGNSWSSPAKTLASSQRSTYTHHPDLYTRHALDSFSFGAASSTPFQANSIDPLSTGRDDESDDYPYKADTTPRPSLVANPSPRSHSSQQLPQMLDYSFPPTSLPPPPRLRHSGERKRKTSNASTHTFGTSSASASASSLSSAAMGSLTGSQRGGSTTTPQTSANELTSDDDEEHRHPIPVCPPSPLLNQNDNLSLYASDYEFDDDSDLDREDFEPDIEISSVIHDDGEQGSLFGYRTPSRNSHSPYPPRKGSLAVPIPSPNSTMGRDREESIATIRRPSRSLENLRSDSRADAHSITSRYGDAMRTSLSPTPISLPGSEGDWREVRRRSVQKEKERELANRTVPSVTLTPSPSPHQDSSSSSSTAIHNPVLEGFDDSWNIDPIAGITNLEMDHSELQDIVGNYQGPRSADRTWRRNSSSTDSGRRLSTTSTSSDPFTKGLNNWLGQQYLDEKMKWTFVRENTDRLEEQRAALERERSISNLFTHRPNNYSQSSAFLGSSSGGFHEHSGFRESKILVKDNAKPKEAQPWKGMAIDAQEWWSSYSNGRYRVIRKSQQNAEAGKPPQQRLNISHHRAPYSMKRDLSDGPSVTIHKHSKAIGFSISRHYRTRPSQLPSVGNLSGRASISSRITVAPTASAERKRSTNMILLAPRRVQEAFTSTTTTRMLQSHGLLNESGRQSPRDLERLEREKREMKRREEETQRQRQKELKKAETKGKDKGKARNGRSDHAASSSESSAGSVVNEMRAPSNNASAGPSHSTRTSVDHSTISLATGTSSQTAVWSGTRRVSYDDSLEIDPDDEDYALYGIKRRAHRTPWGEVFSTLPAEALEQLGKPDPPSYSIFGWNKSKNNPLVHRHLIESFNPPWAVAQARYNPDKKGIVDDLNTSFQDVGLLPAVDEVKTSLAHKRKRQLAEAKQQSKAKEEQPNVFHSFSSDYLYMLLPLWPGETDPHSAKKYPHPIPSIPVESRQYLLVFYKPESVPINDDGDKSKNQRDKKRSRNSPSSSRDTTHKQENRHILFDKFHFCARIVTYTDIQGSGIRSPDVGLSVLGPLVEACETIPTTSYIDTFQVIGLCSSREKGIEFVPEGLEKLGLARRVPDPTATSVDQDSAKRFSITGVDEQDENSDTMLVLTPIGRAVVEMAWLGAMALTSFGSTP